MIAIETLRRRKDQIRRGLNRSNGRISLWNYWIRRVPGPYWSRTLRWDGNPAFRRTHQSDPHTGL